MIEKVVVLPNVIIAVRNEQIQKAVVVIVTPGRPFRQAHVVDNWAVLDLGKRAVSIIVEEEISLIVVEYEEVREAIVIVIGPGSGV